MASSYNPNISNGTCYYAEHTRTRGNFIPCGNDAIQTWPCCHLGSYCLGFGDSNSCWDPTSGNTYVAGCTDPSFTSPECAHKPARFHEQEWVAINQACKDLNNGADEAGTKWTGCEVPDDSLELFKLPLASCTPYCASTDVVYVGSSSLEAFASLPTIAGSSIFWQNNFEPSTTPAPGYTPGTPTGPVGTTGPTGSSPSSDDGNLSTGAKIGIGVGAGVGGLLVIAALVAILLFCLRKRKQRQIGRSEYPDSSFHPAAGAPLYAAVGQSSPPPPPFSTPATATYHHSHHPSQHTHTSSHGSNNMNMELPTAYNDYGPAHNAEFAPYTGYKTELPADEPPGHGLLKPGYQYSQTAKSPSSTGSPPLSSATTAMGGGGSSPGSLAAETARSYSHSHRSFSQRMSPQGGYGADTLPEGATLEPMYGGDTLAGGGGGYYYHGQGGHQQQQQQQQQPPPPPSPRNDYRSPSEFHQ